jgi:hypothetical protein
MHGHFDVDESDIVDSLDDGEERRNVNMGIAIVTPIAPVLQIIYGIKLS